MLTTTSSLSKGKFQLRPVGVGADHVEFEVAGWSGGRLAEATRVRVKLDETRVHWFTPPASHFGLSDESRIGVAIKVYAP